MKNEQIVAIRNKFGISYKEIAQYNNNHKNEIDQINDIFKLENGDNMEKTLALLYMLSLGEDDEAVKKYRDESGLTCEKNDSANLIEQYKYLLLSSLVFNDDFYAMAENYRGIVRVGLGIGLNSKVTLPNEDTPNLLSVSIIQFKDYINKIGEILDGVINFQPWSPALIPVGAQRSFSEGEDNTDITIVKCNVNKNQVDNIYEFELDNETMVKINIPHEYDNNEYSLCIWSTEGDIKKQYHIKTRPEEKMLTAITEPLKAGKYFAAIIKGA